MASNFRQLSDHTFEILLEKIYELGRPAVIKVGDLSIRKRGVATRHGIEERNLEYRLLKPAIRGIQKIAVVRS